MGKVNQKSRSTRRSTRPSRPPARLREQDASTAADTTTSVPQAADTAPSVPQDPIALMQQMMEQQQHLFATTLTSIDTSLQAIAGRFAAQTPTMPTSSPMPPNLPSTSTGLVTSSSMPSTSTNPLPFPSLPSTSNSADHYDSQRPALPATIEIQGESERPILSTASPVGTTVRHSIKLKIWEHKFVDFQDLINPDRIPNYTLSVQDGEDQPQLSVAHKKSKQLSQHEWSTAMDIFTAVYIEKYPDESRAILSYSHFIKRLMTLGANWFLYDKKYRTTREFTKCSWLTVRYDLEREAFLPRNEDKSKSFRSIKPDPSQSKVPPGYCFAYHKEGVRCTNQRCTYKHTCFKCHKHHPAFNKCPTTRYGNSKRERRPTYDSDHSDDDSQRHHKSSKSSKNKNPK